MSVTVKRVDGKRHCFFELIVETEDGMPKHDEAAHDAV